MGRRARMTLGALAVLLGVALVVSLAVSARKTPGRPASPSATANQTATSAVDPSSPDLSPSPAHETAAQAARRLFPDLYETAITFAENPDALRGAQPGRPVAVSRDYAPDRPSLASWALPSEARATSRNLFAEMRSSAMSTTTVLVPVLKNGHAISEFLLTKDASGVWQTAGDLTEPLPSGLIHDFEVASAKLRKALGSSARVRPTVFLPSGLMFAVGDSSKGEAAVFLLPVVHGPGIVGYNQTSPEAGQLFTHAELRAFFNPPKSLKPTDNRIPLGGLD